MVSAAPSRSSAPSTSLASAGTVTTPGETVDVLVTVAAWARGGWSAPLAAVSLVSAVVSGVVLVWLLLTDRLLTDLPAQFHETFGWSEDWSVLLPAVAVGIVVICGWEAVTALRRMRDSDPA